MLRSASRAYSRTRAKISLVFCFLCCPGGGKIPRSPISILRLFVSPFRASSFWSPPPPFNPKFCWFFFVSLALRILSFVSASHYNFFSVFVTSLRNTVSYYLDLYEIQRGTFLKKKEEKMLKMTVRYWCKMWPVMVQMKAESAEFVVKHRNTKRFPVMMNVWRWWTIFRL